MKQKTSHKTQKKNKFRKNNYTIKQKQKIANKIYNLTEKDVLEDFNKLREIGCKYHKELSIIGNKVVNKYTLIERLNTKGKQNVNFYDLYQNREFFKSKPFVNKMLDYYKRHREGYNEAKIFFRISNLYYSAISIFKPLIAMKIYCMYNPTSVLDFTMGWGGRLVGACALDVSNYIGIDNNKNLREPYNKMTAFLNKHSKTNIELYFQDALSIDYSKLNYDLVLTSPPYYNIETYGTEHGSSENKTKEKWDSEFYVPIFDRTFKYLKNGGHYCLNIPKELYVNVAIKVLGKANTRLILPKSKRNNDEKYEEFIYIWQK
jgi:hypothetical protein